jgi:hypothetical protein
VKEPREDDERLSALLEGRVEGRQREDMLAHLAAADEDYEVFTDTAAVLRALEEEDARARRGPVPPSMRKRGWVRTAAYAVSAVVVLLAIGWALRERGGSAGASPLQLAMRVDEAGDGLPAQWERPTPAGAMRGTGGSAERDARAVYAGAMLVDLAVAARAGDTEQTQVLIQQIIRRYDPGASASTPLRRIRADLPADSLNALLEQATARLISRLDRKPLELGAWIEAARLAAREKDAGFFLEDGTGDMLGRAEHYARGNADAEAAVTQVQAALPPGGTPRWEALAASLHALLSQLSG